MTINVNTHQQSSVKVYVYIHRLLKIHFRDQPLLLNRRLIRIFTCMKMLNDILGNNPFKKIVNESWFLLPVKGAPKPHN